MNAVVQDPTVEDKPLDPAVEKIRRKMLRLLLVSIGIMMAGLMAVLVAIVYKTSEGDSVNARPAETSTAVTSYGDLIIPSGSLIISHSLSQNRIGLMIELQDGTKSLRVFDLRTGNPVSVLKIRSE